MRRLIAIACLMLLAAFAASSAAFADLGVGVNTGRMEVAERLEPGRGYVLPDLTVINTGDEVATYAMSVGYQADQVERRPEQRWFVFSPSTSLVLEPGESERVTVSIHLPPSAREGDYFALLRAQTVSNQPGVTSVGIAAAAKLSFSVAETGWLNAWRYRLTRWLEDNSLWLAGATGGLMLAYGAYRVRRLPFRLRIERR